MVALRRVVPYWAESPNAMKLSTFNARLKTIVTASAWGRCDRDDWYSWLTASESRRGETGPKALL